MTTKKFDCVEMKRRGAQYVRKQTAGMTREQEIEYWRRRSEAFEQQQNALRAQANSAKRRDDSPE
jgi:hypothetical protein